MMLSWEVDQLAKLWQVKQSFYFTGTCKFARAPRHLCIWPSERLFLYNWVIVYRSSLENYGGFAHIKCDDLPKEEIETASEAGCDALRVTAVGDGKRYQLYCGGSSLPGGTRQRYPLGVGTKGEEITTVVPLGAMTPTFRGRTIDTAPMTDVGQLTSIALLIADKQKGPFEMHLLSIEAVKLEDTEAKEGTERATTRTGKD